MELCTIAPGRTLLQLSTHLDSRREFNPDKSLEGVGIELEALKSQDCHYSEQATGQIKIPFKVVDHPSRAAGEEIILYRCSHVERNLF